MSYTKSELEEKKVVELRPICRKLGISTKECNGKKAEIISLILKSSKGASPKKSPKKDKASKSKEDKPKKKSKKTKEDKPKPKKSPKKTSPVKSKTPSKSASPTSKKSPPKSIKINENLSAMTVVELKARAKSLKVDLPTKGSGANGGVVKSDIIRAIQDFESRKVGETGRVIKISPVKQKTPKKASPKKESPKKTSPVKLKTPKKSSKAAKFCAVKGKNTCEDDKPICRVTDGKCIKKSKNGEPRGIKTLKKELGDDYYFDEKSGLIGKKEDVLRHLKLQRKASSEPSKEVSKSPVKVDKVEKSKKVSPKCGTVSMKGVEGYKKCKDTEVCDIFTGQCEEPTEKLMSGKISLIVDGRTIIGDKATIEKLHKSIGGTVSLTGKKEKTKTPKAKKVVIDEKTDLMSIEPPKASPKKPKAKASPAKPKPVRTGTSSSSVMESREKIYETFTKCLSEIGSK